METLNVSYGVSFTVKVKNRITGEFKLAVYMHNTGGNLRYHIDGKSITDKVFDKNWEIIK